MKNKKLSFQLNVIHLAHFTLLLIALLVVNFILLKRVNYHNTRDVLEVNCLQLNSSINKKLNTIEKSADFIVDNISLDSASSNKIIEIAKLNPIVKNIQIVKKNNNDNFNILSKTWLVSLNTDSIVQCDYYKTINKYEQLVIELNEKWFDVVLSEKLVNNPSNYNLFNDDLNLHLTTNYKSFADWFEFGNENVLDRIDSNGTFIKTVKYIGSSESYYTFISYIPKLKIYLSVNQTHDNNFLYLGRYPAFISLIFIFIIILISYMIIRTNIKYTRPYSDILNSFESNHFVNINKNSNEPIAIKRGIEQLQNQLNFYVNNLEKTSSENKKIENDLKIAKKLQSNILPSDTLAISKRHEFEISATSEAVFDIGGDLYDYYMLDEKHLLFVVGDISGKGIPAALFMIYTQTLLRSIAKAEMKVSEIIEKLNDKLIEENLSDLFVTMLLGILDIQTGVINYCNAAHNLPFIIRQEGSVEQLDETHGIPLGIYANREYSYTEIQLNPNDQILIYTDGVIDSIDENGMKYSIDVLKYNLMGTWFQTPKEALNKIQKSVEEFRGNIDPVDDMTILIMQFKNKVNT